MSSTAASLDDLPRELISSIVQYLCPRELKNLRLVCRIFELLSFKTFAGAYFSTFTYNFSHYDTEYLKLFVAEERLLPYVKTLKICNTTGTRIIPGTKSDYPRKSLGQGYKWDRGVYGSLTSQEPQIIELGKLLKDRITNCRNIHITNLDKVGIASIYSTQWITSNDALNVLLQIIMEQRLEIQSFNIDYSRSAYTKEVDPARLLSSIQQSSYGNMHVQSLDMRTELGTGLDWTVHFITWLQTLRNLHLQLSGPSEEVDQLFSKLSEAPELPRIRVFSLETTNIQSYKSLESLLARISNTLQKLKLRGIRLSDGDWQLLFQTIAASCRSLNDFSVEFALVEGEPYPIHFSSLLDVAQAHDVQCLDMYGRKDWRSRNACVRYHGVRVADAVGALSEKIEMNISPLINELGQL